MSYKRTFLLGIAASIALVITFFVPAYAEPLDHPLSFHAASYEAPASFVLPDFVVVDHVAVLRSDEPLPAKITPIAALGPIYSMSLATDGQSLPGYHRRC